MLSSSKYVDRVLDLCSAAWALLVTNSAARAHLQVVARHEEHRPGVIPAHNAQHIFSVTAAACRFVTTDAASSAATAGAAATTLARGSHRQRGAKVCDSVAFWRTLPMPEAFSAKRFVAFFAIMHCRIEITHFAEQFIEFNNRVR